MREVIEELLKQENTRQNLSRLRSLIKEHVIEADGKGYVRLSTPHMAEYLRGSSW